MATIHHLTTPIKTADLEKLRIGEKVMISGKIFTARDAAHKRIIKLLETDQPLPFDFQGAVIYYAGPAPARPGRPIGSVGPTSSYRMDQFTQPVLAAGVKVLIGKGERNQSVIDTLVTHRAVYLVAVGGVAVVTAQAVKAARVIAFEDLGPEAIYELEVSNFPAFVAIDINGQSLFETGVASYRRE
ncbi:MAG: FumA C-terminus/TtdB family hydratase beta subunit [Candidatus Marinimicrobia bacterium]|jgi:fumarate hydratase subunit beta|nr:FumA C-terminus/TtdB family hydratase beta subunit [Candidatus Neomarinimicrobiota bacterium]MCK9484931.1 FumA C-terminus/TtdB family hydratase beta subunit [Candidatus Neomarinimicrobiota bacterium]MCK9560314.1 FumA C-terminus/TtdB family hydratase beta subunit [Candidatus Neomarinimicrobiota bacterium]MDD5061659.1 FumA C-terminus/TtdB family hydratase beta subunit [Candidatus Neomarinimicrobiota bacterium]